MNVLKNKHSIGILFLITAILGSHLYPLIVFIICLITLIIFIKKDKVLRNYNLFFIFIFWPLCFYVYLYLLICGIVDSDVLITNFKSPVCVQMNLESFAFWALRFPTVSIIEFSTIGLKISPFFMLQFLIETYYCAALFCEFFKLSFSLTIPF